ncbi:S-layer protein, partial [Candidatus Woesearchaeota archaeon]|nr:S-layer protein [Candidatus Woesearchaeota archaeon]
KKIAALVAGTTMLGATIMGAAADLSDYPAPFVTNGVFDGKIVVGASAATSDVVGAIDIAASLQAEATSTQEISIPGIAGMASVTGDAAEFKTGSDIVRIGESIGDVKQTFTHNDLDALASGVFDTGESSTPVKQYLKFGNTTASVVYEQNGDDEVMDYLKFDDGSFMFEYHMEFTEGAVSDIGTGGALDDLESEVITLLGAPFTIVDATVDGSELDLSMLGGEVADTLRDGETKTYTIDGKDYEVTAVFISSSSPESAKLSVNGMLTKELEEGETDVLGADVTIGVQEILTNQREGIVEFYLGANKLEIRDSDFTNGAYAEETVKVGGERIDNAWLDLKATNTTDELTLNYIKYKVAADDDYWIPPGKGLKEFLDEPESMITDTWDVLYAGLMKSSVTTIEFNSVSDHSYKLEFENYNGDVYDFPLLTNKDGTYKYGDDDDDLLFIEPYSRTPTGGDNDTFVSDDDYFVVSDGAVDINSDTAVVNVMRYKSISTGDSTVTFEDLAADVVVVSFTGTPGAGASGELIVAGASHTFWVGGVGTGQEDYALAIDLDGDGGINSKKVLLVTRGGGIIDLGTQTFTGANNCTGGGCNPDVALTANTVINISTPIDNFDESTDAGTTWLSVAITNITAGNEIDLDVTEPSLYEWHEDEDYDRGMTSYGVFVEEYNPSGTEANEAIIEYPLAQRGGQAFVVAGTVSVQEGTAAGGGSVTTEVVNPIAVGLAVLDTDAPALGSKNMIMVGGPCVNTVAAELMGNPEVCTEGFTPGKAVIKLYTAQNALLVAGYSAQDTLGASYVLSDYEDYDLTGTEVEVVVTSLRDIDVNPVS